VHKFLLIFKLWLIAWGIVTGLSLGIRWVGLNFPIVVQTMIISGVMIPIMVLVVIPLIKPETERIVDETDV
jgi:hypothetical protein